MNATNTIIRTAPDLYQNSIEKYIEIIEKTNGQLGWWLNISNFMITLLGVLVAVIAIFVGIAMWKNTKEQKDKFEEFLKSQEKLFTEKTKEFEEENKKRREESRTALEELISEQQEKLNSAENDNKKEIQKFINELKKEKATIGVQTGTGFLYAPIQDSSTGFYTTSGTGLSSTNSILARPISSVTGGIGIGSTGNLVCPHCGHMKTFSYGDYCGYCGNKF